ncbi:acetyltransferase [Streptomyces sp. R302]|uniref:GNAT family N-acetyltransferase n=1 Tax=unclassified Streptomyces TaxID=2593676 RepID=UPI00145E52BF|nr:MULTISPECIES: GNAT family N-acetyltransferase [unclassified Streptomyces]NML54193.1 acetyltransferase [Streptomyces sp. R301]NML83453.1 acetyltransferase [Streptomyces sp. R302]
MSIHPDHRHDAGTPATAHPPTEPADAAAGDDTLDLRVADLLALLARDRTGPGPGPGPGPWPGPGPGPDPGPGTGIGTAVDRRLDGDLLDSVASWAPAATRFGDFRLVPVRPERDLPLLTRWMNDPAVAAFWELAGPDAVTADHVRAQLEGDGRSVPCLGVLDSTPMSYFEIYRADLDPLARAYPALPHDTGVHLLLGGVADRGRGVGTALLRAVADLVLDHRPRCTRVVAEPDIRNTPSVSAFLSAGFRYAAEIDLPDKRAALMIRDRALRHVL